VGVVTKPSRVRKSGFAPPSREELASAASAYGFSGVAFAAP
jgi:hypothetical protein